MYAHALVHTSSTLSGHSAHQSKIFQQQHRAVGVFQQRLRLDCAGDAMWPRSSKCWARVSPLTQPFCGTGKCVAAVMKQHLKMGLFHSEITTAMTCFAGIPALCQAGESSDAEQPNPPNIKGNEAVPMGLVLLSGHRNVASELSFEEHSSEVQRELLSWLSQMGLCLPCTTNQYVSKRLWKIHCKHNRNEKEE